MKRLENMDFRTKIDIPQSGITINHQNKIVMFGSCFVENIGEQLLQNKFDVNLNPFGILYNPLSISQSINRLLNNSLFNESELFEYKGLYHSFSHHSRFSDADKDYCLERINIATQHAIDDLKEAPFLFITFGTSYVYKLKENAEIVSNCHKLPASSFTHYRLDVDIIVKEWAELLQRLFKANPLLNIIFTVSPIRHLNDGAHENQLSKSILLLAVDHLCKANDNVYYFPSYEIMLDELRDYRFYTEDMVHPNSVAMKYIWERFSESFFSDDTLRIIAEWNKIRSAINHRPFNDMSEEYKHFLIQTILKLDIFNKKYPYICCNIEREVLSKRLQNLK